MPGPGQRSVSLRLRPQDQTVLRPAARAILGPLARAHIAALAHDAAHDLVGLSEQGLEILWEGLFDLPTVDLSLHVKLPELITPVPNTSSPQASPTPWPSPSAQAAPPAASESPPNPDHSSSGSSQVSLSLDVERDAGDDDLRKRCEGVA